jgi:hypothetical protein
VSDGHDLIAETRRLGLLKKRETILSRRKKEATKRRVEQERLVHGLMLHQGFSPDDNDGIKLGGMHFSPQETHFAVVQDKQALVQWIKDHDDSIVEDRLKQEELNHIVRTRLDNGEPLPPGLGFWTKDWVSTKGVKANATQQPIDEPDNEQEAPDE